MVLYHLMIEGDAVVELENGKTLELAAGDVVVFPQGEAHYMSSGKGAKRPFPNYGERFTRYLTEPPMAYLTRWRLELAAREPERTSRGVAEIAAGVGYESEAAFSRVFKREFARPSGRYRSNYRRNSDEKSERRPPENSSD